MSVGRRVFPVILAIVAAILDGHGIARFGP